MFSRQTGVARIWWGRREDDGGNTPALNGVVELEGVSVPSRHRVERHIGKSGNVGVVWWEKDRCLFYKSFCTYPQHMGKRNRKEDRRREIM